MNALVKGHYFQPQNHYKQYRDSNKAISVSETCLHQLENPHLINIKILQNEWKKNYISLEIVRDRWKIIPKFFLI